MDKQRNNSVWHDLMNLVIKIMAIVVTFMVITTFFYGVYRNSDPDMFPKIKDGDPIMFYRLDKEYAIGDLLVLDFKGERQVRRVVARAGDIVDITEDGLMVNGAMQQELEIIEKTERYAEGIAFPLTVQEGQVFVLGDARQNASDSRIYGAVNTKDTLGKVITVVRWRNM